MTQAEKRVLLAEYFGWTFNPIIRINSNNLAQKSEATACWVAPGYPPWQMRTLPDYFNDFHVINQALLTLSPAQGARFCQVLNDMSIVGEWNILNTSCVDRADALGIFLNLWDHDA